MSAGTLRESQLQMARYLRRPDQAPAPDVEERRLKVYRDLIFNNVERFISGGFPVLRTLYSEADWVELVRSFMQGHRCQSPYFLEISQEFIRYLAEEHVPRDCDPVFLTELAHYEWVELALDVAEEELPPPLTGPAAEGVPLTLSPLAWVLSYRYPVHLVGPRFRPSESDENTYLVVYRDRDDAVQFMALNAATARLLELFRDNREAAAETLLETLAGELATEVQAIRNFAWQQIEDFAARGVLVQVQPAYSEVAPERGGA